MELKFYRCKVCGKIIAIVKDTGVPTICCGEEMEQIIPGTTDAAVEKHVPVITVNGNTVEVKVGSVEEVADAIAETEGGDKKVLDFAEEAKKLAKDMVKNPENYEVTNF